MALVASPTGKLTFDFLDETGSRGKSVLHFVNTALVADVLAAATAIVPQIAAITGCTITGYSAAYSTMDNNPLQAEDGARVENKGVFIFRLANGLFSRVELPGILESTLLPSGSIDVENADVAAFLTSIITAPAIFRGMNGSDITAVSAAYQRFRRSTRAMLPSDRAKFG